MTDQPPAPAPPATRPAPPSFARSAPRDADILGSAETLLARFAAQLSDQLTHLRPFPPDTGPDGTP